eukprot:TRINITY_DN31154_c0_g1_i1.p1 TRINITY_DN31154_c0_g1~~TRINITY_DN31154_c0_g1_i1.p1  ORF type:complete len:56 (-),score=2.39 TRINITY_DN31154_c0_g1_i1:73-240(-)
MYTGNHTFILELDQNRAKSFPRTLSNWEKTHGWFDPSLRSVKVSGKKKEGKHLEV